MRENVGMIHKGSQWCELFEFYHFDLLYIYFVSSK